MVVGEGGEIYLENVWGKNEAVKGTELDQMIGKANCSFIGRCNSGTIQLPI